MSLKKPIIKVTRECEVCSGKGKKISEYFCFEICNNCNGIGKLDIRKNNTNFKKYYIKNLEEVIKYWTKLYQNKNDEAQEYLGKVREYSKELDKVVNK